MFGYNKKYFEGQICHIENDIAYIKVIGENGEESFLEDLPKEDLVSAKILFTEGNVFSITLKRFCGWEKIIFKLIKRPKITQEELDELEKYYNDKYGDV